MWKRLGLGIVLAVAMAWAGPAYAEDAAWGPCPDYMNAPDGVTCAMVKAPLDHGNPGQGDIDLLVMRALGKSEKKKGRLWFLMGGPGMSVNMFAAPFPVWAKRYPDYDLYAMEHRGVGASTLMDCPGIEPQTKECAQYLLEHWGRERMAAFNPTQAAHDLALVMDRFKGDGREYLYALSYGTYLAQRFLYFYPDRLAGVVLDGVVPAAPENGEMVGDVYDRHHDELVRDIMNQCAADPGCQKRLAEFADSPLEGLNEVYRRIDSGKLAPDLAKLVNRENLRHTLAAMAANWHGRMVVPAAIYRLLRGAPGDVKVMQALFDDNDPTATSIAYNLGANIFVSDLLMRSTLKEAEAFSAQALASPDVTLDHLIVRDRYGWPVYPPDKATHQWPETDTPILIVNGDMDPQTTVGMARFAAEHFNGPNQRLVVFPTSPHGVFGLSLIRGVPLQDFDTCGTRMIFKFLDNPNGQPDTSCLEGLVKPDYSGTTEYAREAATQFFDAPEVWD